MRVHGGEKGFTLLEMLIAISVVATVASLIVQVFFTTTHVNTKTEILKDVKQNGDVAVDVMTRMIRNSLAVTSTCDETGTKLTSLDIQNPDGDSTEFGCLYDATNKITRIASTSALTSTTQYLTSENVTLGGTSCIDANNTLTFTCTSSPNEADKITITFQLAQKGSSPSQFEQANMPFQTTVSSRN